MRKCQVSTVQKSWSIFARRFIICSVRLVRVFLLSLTFLAWTKVSPKQFNLMAQHVFQCEREIGQVLVGL